jgi:hypothetical protein
MVDNLNNDLRWKQYRGIKRIRCEFKKHKNRLKNDHFKLFVPTYYDTYFLDKLLNTKLVIVIHDLICENHKLTLEEIENKKNL